MNTQKRNWLLDAALLVGFLVSFFTDWTGIRWHQWLGAVLAVGSIYHLLLHWKWVVSITPRLFSRVNRQCRNYYVVDLTLLFGFLTILVSGLGISTWLNLDLKLPCLERSAYLFLFVFSRAAAVENWAALALDHQYRPTSSRSLETGPCAGNRWCPGTGCQSAESGTPGIYPADGNCQPGIPAFCFESGGYLSGRIRILSAGKSDPSST